MKNNGPEVTDFDGPCEEEMLEKGVTRPFEKMDLDIRIWPSIKDLFHTLGRKFSRGNKKKVKSKKEK